MIKVTFKNLKKSNLAEKVVLEKMNLLVEKFPELEQNSIQLTLSMDNSKIQAGPDEYGIKVQIKGKKFEGLILEKRAKSLYLAMAMAYEALLELLNRRIDKIRVKSRTQLRKIKHSINSLTDENEVYE
jgi:ribosome-associated translation inhibitor RaiA